MLLKQTLVFIILHVYTQTNKSKILPVLNSNLLTARSFNSFHLIRWWGSFPWTDSFHRFFVESPKNLQKLLVYGKFPHQKIRRKILFTQCLEILQTIFIFRDNYILSVYHYVCFNSKNIHASARNYWENSRKKSRSIRCC